MSLSIFNIVLFFSIAFSNYIPASLPGYYFSFYIYDNENKSMVNMNNLVKSSFFFFHLSFSF